MAADTDAVDVVDAVVVSGVDRLMMPQLLVVQSDMTNFCFGCLAVAIARASEAAEKNHKDKLLELSASKPSNLLQNIYNNHTKYI